MTDRQHSDFISQYICVMRDFDEQLFKLVDAALNEDVGDGDHSTLSCIPADVMGQAVLKIKQDGIMAGVAVAEKIFRYKEPAAVFTAFKNDCEEMKVGEKAFEVEALVHTILQCERLVLNCIQRMSGIATLTKQYTDGVLMADFSLIVKVTKTSSSSPRHPRR